VEVVLILRGWGCLGIDRFSHLVTTGPLLMGRDRVEGQSCRMALIGKLGQAKKNVWSVNFL
jgi:hypothetical protein